jgi:restriction endonuclease S subunit
MPICMTTMTSDLYSHGRSDPEYYLPRHTQVEADLNLLPTVPMRRLGTFSCSAFYPAATHLYSEDGMPFLRCVDIIDFPLISQDQPFARIPEDFVAAHSSIRSLSAGDIVISKVGTPCYASLLAEDMPPAAMTRTVLGMSRISKELVNPFYLIAFLRSRYGFDQLMRERELTIQYQLTLDRIRKIRVFLPNRSTQNEIGALVQAYYQALRDGVAAYKHAQNLLESELGLDKLSFQKPVGYTARLREVIANSRTDADYFQIKYKQLDNVAVKFPVKKIKAISEKLETGIYSLSYSFDGRMYLRGVDINKGFIDGDSILRTKHLVANPKNTVIQDDILVTRVGSIGVCAIIENTHTGSLFSDNLIRIRISDQAKEEIEAQYLNLLLNTTYGQMQMVRYSRGSVQQRLNQSQVAQIPVPIIKWENQLEIVGLLKKYRKDIKESKQLLDQAKTRVDQLIEEAIQS